MEPAIVKIEIRPLQSPELTPAKCRGGSSGHHNLDCLWFDVAQDQANFAERQNVGIALPDRALTDGCDRIQFGVEFVAYAVRKQGTHVVAYFRL